MSNRYLVTHVAHYIGARLVMPGEVVELPANVKPGRWLVPVEAAVAKPDQADQGADSAYAARHVGGGNWVVERVADGERVASFGKTDGEAKALAMAETDRLNAGGEVALVSTDAAPSSGQDDPPAGTSDDQLPDA